MHLASMLFTNIPKFEELDKTSKAVYHGDKEHYNEIARKGGSILLFARAGSQDETWVPLIEKAYAKLYGNFAHLEGGFTSEAVEDLTGGVSTIFISKVRFSIYTHSSRPLSATLGHLRRRQVLGRGA